MVHNKAPDRGEKPGLWRLLWAKSGGDGTFHPLWCHLLDAMFVALELWRQAVSRPFRRAICGAIGTEEETAGRWVGLLAGLHDIGKACPDFQDKDAILWQRLREAGFERVAGAPDRLPHGRATEAIVMRALTQPPEGMLAWPSNAARQAATVLAGHHGVFPSGTLLGLDDSRLGDGPWSETREHLCRLVFRAAEVEGLVPPRGFVEENQALLCRIAGLMSVADWIASDRELFPYRPDAEPDEYTQSAAELAERAIERLGWKAPVRPEDALSFERTFGFSPNPAQEEILRHVEELNEPVMLIVEAPMGEGKTEAALAVSDHFARHEVAQGVYVAMPTQATANAMFLRFKDGYLAKRFPCHAVNFHLVHGHAMLSEEYQQLLSVAQVWAEDDNPEGQQATADAVRGGTVQAQEWFSYRKRGLLSPYAVGTIDQSLLAALKTRHVAVRHFGLAHKCIIFDEVHAYDAYTSTLLERLLSWASALGSCVVLLSATLSSSRRRALIEAYAGTKVAAGAPAEYPRVTFVTQGNCSSAALPCSRQEPLRIEAVASEPRKLAARLCEALGGGGCAAIICNTVRRAQELYRSVAPVMRGCGIEVGLFHARFPFEERESREHEAVKRFGKNRSGRPSKAVLIATQVIEQSLDLDFDLMISELAPIDLLLQRAGRLHRHRGNPRPPLLQDRCLWVLDDGREEDGLPKLDEGTQRVYAPYLLWRTWLVLRGRELVHIPDDVEEMIEAVYEDQGCAGLSSDAAGRIDEARSSFEARLDQLRRHAEERFIPRPGGEWPLSRLTSLDLEDPELAPEMHPQLLALTRWEDVPTVSIACLFGSAEEAFLDAAGQRRLRLEDLSDLGGVKQVLRREVRVSGHRVCTYFQRAGVPSEWRAVWDRSALLRNVYPAFFDGEGKLVTAGAEQGPPEFSLRVDPELGIVIAYAAEEE